MQKILSECSIAVFHIIMRIPIRIPKHSMSI